MREISKGKILGLAHIAIKVKNIYASISFYELLGFKKTDFFVMDNGSAIAFISIGNCILELIQLPMEGEYIRGQIDHFALEVCNIELLVADLQEKNIKFTSSDIEEKSDVLGGIKHIFLQGPDDEVIELFDFCKE